MGQCLGKEKDLNSKKPKKGPTGVFRLTDNMAEHESLMSRNPQGHVPLDPHTHAPQFDDEKVIKLSEPMGLRDSSSDDEEPDLGDDPPRLPIAALGGRTRDVTSSDEDIVDLHDDLEDKPVTRQNHNTPPTTNTFPPPAAADSTSGTPHTPEEIPVTTLSVADPTPISKSNDKISFKIGGGKKKRQGPTPRGPANGTHHPPGPPYPLETQYSSEDLSYSSIREDLKSHPDKLNDPTHDPKLFRAAIPPQFSDNFHRVKSSSTSTLFINTTIKAPDNDEIVKCMSVALYWLLQKNENRPKKHYDDIWNEEKHRLDDKYEEMKHPDQGAVYKFLSVIFQGEQLSAECGVMCMAYIDRLNALTGIPLVAETWRRIVLGALILASKVWEDQAVWNVDFLSVFPHVNVKDLNGLERAYLNALQFNVTLKASVYARYYFELKSLSEKDATHFPLKPLDKDGRKRLEERSQGLEKTFKKPKIKRSQSADQFHAPTIPVSIQGT